MRKDLVNLTSFEEYYARYLLDETIIGYDSLDSVDHKDLGTFLLNLTEVFLDSASPTEANLTKKRK